MGNRSDRLRPTADAKPLRWTCGLCKNIGKGEELGYTRAPERKGIEEPCCLRRLLWQQSDFQESYDCPAISEMIKDRGQVCLFLPKFHPELNFIELVWARAKHELRKLLTGSSQEFLELVLSVLDKIRADVSYLQRCARHCYRYMDYYNQGMDTLQAQNAAKVYRSHRKVGAAAAVQV
jgi:hypothetical protein